jgi:hypothetical protein
MASASLVLWLAALQPACAARKQVVWGSFVPPLAVLMAQPDIVTRWVKSSAMVSLDAEIRVLTKPGPVLQGVHRGVDIVPARSRTGVHLQRGSAAKVSHCYLGIGSAQFYAAHADQRFAVVLCREEAAAESQDDQQQSSEQARQASECSPSHQASEHLQPLKHAVTQAAGAAAGTQQASPLQGRTQQQDGDAAAQHQKQFHRKQPLSAKAKAAAAQESSSTRAAHQQAAAAHTSSWKDAYQEQDSINNCQQQQQQQAWPQPSWGYPGWDAAAGAAGWGWPGYEQQYGWPPMPPPPPPAPPLPGCFMHATAGQQQQQQLQPGV